MSPTLGTLERLEQEEYSDSDEDIMVPGDVSTMPLTSNPTSASSGAPRVSRRVRIPNKLYNNAEWVRYDDHGDSEPDGEATAGP